MWQTRKFGHAIAVVNSQFAWVHVQDYDAALQTKPEHVLAHIRKGMVLQALKRPEVCSPSISIHLFHVFWNLIVNADTVTVLWRCTSKRGASTPI